MSLRLFNTLTRTLDPFEPLAPPAVTMYVCGPTVYDVPHIGHLRSAYVFDVLRRYLAAQGFQVTFIRNVTDVDDKIIAKAREELGARDKPAPALARGGPGGQGAGDALKRTCQEVAERYLKAYHEALDRLGIERPTKEPKATEHVVADENNVAATKKIDASMTGFISHLMTKNMAYPADGDVYFSVRRYSDYGKLSNRSVDELKSGARVEPGDQKEDPLDFALWKAAKPDEPSWNSPWGPGRPGWHIECSVMSTAYLGDAFDIHGGGVDLVFPHHENELAQARALDKPFAKYWVHNGLLTVNGEKMSKSLGNFITVEQVLKDWKPEHLKLFFLKTHYRSPIDYSDASMREAKKNWEEFDEFFQHYIQTEADSVTGGALPEQAREFLAQFQHAMDDDLNTPRALSVLFNLVNLGHATLNSGQKDKLFLARGIKEILVECSKSLGLSLKLRGEDVSGHLQQKIQERELARKAGDFMRADAIRKELEREGILLTDTAGKTLWRRLD